MCGMLTYSLGNSPSANEQSNDVLPHAPVHGNAAGGHEGSSEAGKAEQSTSEVWQEAPGTGPDGR